MVLIKFNILFYAIIFMLLHSVTYSLQDTKKMVVMARDKIVEEEGTLLYPKQKDTLNVFHVDVEVGKITGGRKMMKKVNEEHIHGKQRASKMATSASSANTKNGDLKVPKRTKKIHHKHHDHEHDHDVEVKMSSTFMSLNADYYVPRSHPPRNN